MSLLDDIKAFCETHGVSITRFGELAMNDKGFVHDLENRGRRMWPETEQRVRRFISTYKPDAPQDAAA